MAGGVIAMKRTNVDQFIATKACKQAVKLYQPLEMRHMEDLIKKWAEAENPWVLFTSSFTCL